MSALLRSANLARKALLFAPSAVCTRSPALWRNGQLLARAASGRSVLDEIDKKSREAEIGGGIKRIEKQHEKVALICFVVQMIPLLD
jgi:hypothetical protein